MSDGEFQTYGIHEGPIFPREEDFVFGPSKIESMTGVEKITKERLEQKVKHNKTIKNDYQLYPDFELATLAQSLITGNYNDAPDCFPTELIENLFEKCYEDRLVVAGALIAAQIDVLNFEE